MPSKYLFLANSLRALLKQHKTETGFRLPTEKELSAQYKVSRQTVRHALSVLEDEGLIVRRQGSGSYPSPTLLSSSTRIVAVVLPDTGSYLHSSAIRDIQTFFNSHNYMVRLFMTDYLFEREQEILRSLCKEPPAALLAKTFCTALPHITLSLYQEIAAKGTPVVFWDGSPLKSDFVSINADFFAGGYELSSYLINQQHQHIAGIFQKEEIESHEKFAGFIHALQEHDIPLDSRNIFWYDSISYPYTKKTLEPSIFPEEFLKWITLNCTSVLCHNDEAAYALIKALLQKNVPVPGNISVVSFDNSHLSELSPVRITSMSCEKEKPWSAAAQFLLQQLQGKEPVPPRLSWQLIKKDSG